MKNVADKIDQVHNQVSDQVSDQVRAQVWDRIQVSVQVLNLSGWRMTGLQVI